MERLFVAKSHEQAIEIQIDFAKTAYEAFIAEATKIGGLYVDLVKEAHKPFEPYVAKH